MVFFAFFYLRNLALLIQRQVYAHRRDASTEYVYSAGSRVMNPQKHMLDTLGP